MKQGKDKSDGKLHIYNACYGSYLLLKENKDSKHVFWVHLPKENKYLLVDNRKDYKEFEFASYEELIKYVGENF